MSNTGNYQNNCIRIYILSVDQHLDKMRGVNCGDWLYEILKPNRANGQLRGAMCFGASVGLSQFSECIVIGDRHIVI